MINKLKMVVAFIVLALSVSSCKQEDLANNEGKEALLTQEMRDFISITAGVKGADVQFNPKTNHVFVPNTPISDHIDSVQKHLDFVKENNPDFFTQFQPK
ncbi:hypothetical protein H8S90_12965 [Olivibacter sp. SDN3]|uniref:hypothetical protein n=1 Tax=Olivibacter sp. SDN3 TaxID=2764720 RepID=UPI001650DC20|nr:hypothetical protein [Olivibacter sp. SDN3]QNL47735.1 hypothetical protein H8S90_12965 [Olivibacter sp. SDN3]